MKQTLLFIFLLTSVGLIAQTFSTGEQTLLSNLKANIVIDGNTNITTLTLKGPSDRWFAIGFGGLSMSSQADVFMTDGSKILDAKVSGLRRPPSDSSQDWALVSNNVSGSERTIVATRANNTGDSDDFVFNPNTGSLQLIYAVGTTSSFVRHSSRGFTSLSVLSAADIDRIDFDIFPNPAKDDVTIQLPLEQNNVTLQFYDYIGKLVATKNITNVKNTFSVSDLASGVYILKVVSGTKIGTQKFVKK